MACAARVWWIIDKIRFMDEYLLYEVVIEVLDKMDRH